MGDPELFQGRNCGQEEGAARESQRGPAQLNDPNMEKSVLVSFTPSEAYNHNG